MAQEPSRAQQLLGDLAPKMVQLTDDVLFGDVWKREGLSPRDRSLITVSVLAATYRPDQLNSHLRLALENGLNQGRTRRGPHPLGLLCRMAQRDGRADAAQGHHRE